VVYRQQRRAASTWSQRHVTGPRPLLCNASPRSQRWRTTDDAAPRSGPQCRSRFCARRTASQRRRSACLSSALALTTSRGPSPAPLFLRFATCVSDMCWVDVGFVIHLVLIWCTDLLAACRRYVLHCINTKDLHICR
jgi:hypothetical protein